MTEAGKIFWAKLNISDMYSSMVAASRMSSALGRGICWKRLLITAIPFLSVCLKRPGEESWWKIITDIGKEFLLLNIIITAGKSWGNCTKCRKAILLSIG